MPGTNGLNPGDGMTFLIRTWRTWRPRRCRLIIWTLKDPKYIEATLALLGGELPMNRVGGWTNPGDINGIFVGASRPQKYLGWTNPLTIRGMNHQVCNSYTYWILLMSWWGYCNHWKQRNKVSCDIIPVDCFLMGGVKRCWHQIRYCLWKSQHTQPNSSNMLARYDWYLGLPTAVHGRPPESQTQRQISPILSETAIVC